MVEKEFVEEFFLQTIKAKKEKTKKTAGKSGKSEKSEKTLVKKERKEIEKMGKELKPVIGPRTLPEKRKKQAAEQETEEQVEIMDEETKEELASDIDVPEPPRHLLEIPEPPAPPTLLEPPGYSGRPTLPTPPKFFEPGIGIKPIVDLGKLNNLITDPSVESIQCDGSFMPIKIIRNEQEVNTQIELDDREINDIINKFAQASQKQVQGPVFKATIKGLNISAVISEFAGTKFIITKG